MLFLQLLLYDGIHLLSMQEWLEENEGSSLFETLYKALDEVSSTLRLKPRRSLDKFNMSRIGALK